MSQMKLPARDQFSNSYLLDVWELIRSKKLFLQTITSINLSIQIKTRYLGLCALLVFMNFRCPMDMILQWSNSTLFTWQEKVFEAYCHVYPLSIKLNYFKYAWFLNPEKVYVQCFYTVAIFTKAPTLLLDILFLIPLQTRVQFPHSFCCLQKAFSTSAKYQVITPDIPIYCPSYHTYWVPSWKSLYFKRITKLFSHE